MQTSGSSRSLGRVYSTHDVLRIYPHHLLHETRTVRSSEVPFTSFGYAARETNIAVDISLGVNNSYMHSVRKISHNELRSSRRSSQKI